MSRPPPAAAGRERVWQSLDRPWDVVVVGGGITGAGVLRAAARCGLRALLVEERDFAWGTSSRSTKLVHGGLRYLAQGRLSVTRTAVAERERLLREAPGLVTPMPFLLPLRAGARAQRLTLESALVVYEALAGRVRRHGVSPQEVLRLVPGLEPDGLRGGLRYFEAETDDARLVLQVLGEAVAAGGVALNAVRAACLRRRAGRVVGLAVEDVATGRAAELSAQVVVNATGIWADRLRGQVGGAARMRPARGSHLLISQRRLPLRSGVVIRSPRDGRHVSVFPWRGATVVGTTDLDQPGDLDREPRITPDETAYLLECLEEPFRSLHLDESDVVSTWSGLRPLVRSGAAQSCDELRGHVVWDEQGLVTGAGGKLTTFAALARDVLRAAAPHLSRNAPLRSSAPAQQDRPPLLGAAPEEVADWAERHLRDDEPVAGTGTSWSQVRWSARWEAVRSLDDLMLRRTRLGLLLPRGGEEVLDRVRGVCAEELGWDEDRWAQERAAYAAVVADSYSVPSGTSTVSPAGTASAVSGSGPTGSPSA